jgi:hypothetical protein
MKTILIHAVDGNAFDPDARDRVSDPGIFLREKLLSLGYRLDLSADYGLDDCVWVFFYDATSVLRYHGLHGIARWMRDCLIKRRLLRDLYTECQRAGLEQRIALFLWEPPSTTFANYDARLHNLFPTIFTWNDDLVDGRKFHKVCIPQPRQFPELPAISFSQKKLLVNISANKYSRHPRELYSARRATIRHFERVRPDDFDLYGVGWNRPATLVERRLPFVWHRYPSYRGTVRHKWDVLPRYRFSVCYENIRDEPGYVTEKIFDSLRADCVPIYWGASNITDYVNEGAFIDRRQFGSNLELERFIIGITETEYKRFQANIQAYLASERFAQFLPPAFAETIIRVLHL